MRSGILLVLLLTGVSVTRADAPVGYARTIEVNVELAEGAVQTEIEITSPYFPKPEYHKFTGEVFRFQSASGDLKARVRSLDRRGVPSEWGESFELKVRPKKVQLPIEDVAMAEPATEGQADGKTEGKTEGKMEVKADSKAGNTPSLTVSEKTMHAEKKVQWPKAEGAASYRIEVFDKAGQVCQKVESKDPEIALALPPGEFRYQITSVSDNGFESEPSQLSRTITVSGAQIAKPEFKLDYDKIRKHLAWTGAPQAEKFSGHLDYRNLESEVWRTMKVFKDQTAREIVFDPELKPGVYRMSVVGHAEKWVDSEAAQIEFVIKPTERELSSVGG
jgi:hypothetical protein